MSLRSFLEKIPTSKNAEKIFEKLEKEMKNKT